MDKDMEYKHGNGHGHGHRQGHGHPQMDNFDGHVTKNKSVGTVKI
jgi:hypothetical protein